MKKLTVMVVGPVARDQTHYRLPGCHPFAPEQTGTHARPAPPTPGILIRVGRWEEIEVVDDRHEEILRQDHFLKFKEAEAPAEASEPAPSEPAAAAEEPAAQTESSQKSKKAKR